MTTERVTTVYKQEINDLGQVVNILDHVRPATDDDLAAMAQVEQDLIDFKEFMGLGSPPLTEEYPKKNQTPWGNLGVGGANVAVSAVGITKSTPEHPLKTWSFLRPVHKLTAEQKRLYTKLNISIPEFTAK